VNAYWNAARYRPRAAAGAAASASALTRDWKSSPPTAMTTVAPSISAGRQPDGTARAARLAALQAANSAAPRAIAAVRRIRRVTRSAAVAPALLSPVARASTAPGSQGGARRSSSR